MEGTDRVLPTYPPDRSASAARQLERLGVTVRTGTKVVDVDERSVTAETADGRRERMPRGRSLWAAGVLAASFGRAVAEAVGRSAGPHGRIIVGPDLTVPGHPEIFVVGDAALQPWRKDKPVPGVAQGAIQSGAYVARRSVTADGEPVTPFRYRNRGDVAVIGRLAGVTDIPWLGPLGRQSGFPAWFLWLGIHIVYLIGFANRIVVSVRWAWSFLTHGRGSRLITGEPLVPQIADPGSASENTVGRGPSVAGDDVAGPSDAPTSAPFGPRSRRLRELDDRRTPSPRRIAANASSIPSR